MTISSPAEARAAAPLGPPPAVPEHLERDLLLRGEVGHRLTDHPAADDGLEHRTGHAVLLARGDQLLEGRVGDGPVLRGGLAPVVVLRGAAARRRIVRAGIACARPTTRCPTPTRADTQGRYGCAPRRGSRPRRPRPRRGRCAGRDCTAHRAVPGGACAPRARPSAREPQAHAGHRDLRRTGSRARSRRRDRPRRRTRDGLRTSASAPGAAGESAIADHSLFRACRIRAIESLLVSLGTRRVRRAHPVRPPARPPVPRIS